MTSRKQLKSRVRARMARTGESYTTALRHTAGPAGPVEHAGYRLRGGASTRTRRRCRTSWPTTAYGPVARS